MIMVRHHRRGRLVCDSRQNAMETNPGNGRSTVATIAGVSTEDDSPLPPPPSADSSVSGCPGGGGGGGAAPMRSDFSVMPKKVHVRDDDAGNRRK